MFSLFEAFCNLIYFALHITGTGSFPRPLSAKKSRKASGDAALRDLLWDKAKGKTFWRGSGQARFGDYNRHVVICWDVLI